MIHSKKTIIIIWILVDIISFSLLIGLIFLVKQKIFTDYIKIAITSLMALFFNVIFCSLCSND
jgi:hypothetical protein